MLLEHPKVQLYGGIALLIFTWVIISLPTNAHTFFYKLKIGDVVTEDLKMTKDYSQQIASRSVVDSAYYDIEKKVMNEWIQFENEVKSGVTGSGFGKYAANHIAQIDTILGSGYMIPTPQNTNKANDATNTMAHTYSGSYRELRGVKGQIRMNNTSLTRTVCLGVNPMKHSHLVLSKPT